MKKKQLFAALLAVSCVASMAVPAFADDTIEELVEDGKLASAIDGSEMGFEELEEYKLSVTTDIQKPTLKVTLPSATGVLVNPYRIEIEVDTGVTSFDTVLSPVMKVTNNSGCAINVGVSGLLQTYTVVKDFSATADGVVEYVVDNGDPETATPNTNDCVVNGTIEGVDKIYSSDAKNFYTADGKQVTVKYSKPTYATKADDSKNIAVGDLTKPGSIEVTGYTASKNIKVSTSAIKDEDADKSNTLFMYVEGSTTNGEWASAFDAKKVATAASPAGMMALTAKETKANVLYLNGASGGTATEGYVRVTGQASTAPTNAWSTLTDKFDANFTFVVDAVANAKPSAPKAEDITFTKVTGIDFSDTTTYNKGALALATGANSSARTVSVTVDAPAGVTTKVTVTGDASMDGDTDVLFDATNGGKATITVELTQYGLTTTYEFEVAITVA